MLHCAVLDDYQDVARRFGDWGKLAGQVEPQVFTDHIDDRAALAAALADAGIVIAMRERTPFDRALFERLPKLRLLVTTGMKNASIDLKAAADRGVTVCGTGASPGPTAELTWGLIHALMRQIPREFANFQHAGKWQLTVGRELAGRRLGVIGLGRLGSRVARVGLAFDMQVSAWSKNLTPERCAEIGVAHAGSLDELLRTSDIASIHLVLSDRTRGLIGARELGLMQPHALLINTSRGPIVDEAALIAALKEKRIAGAGIDVFDREPLPRDHPFRSLDNIVATPHLGYVTEETYRIYFQEAVEDIAAWLAGKPVRVIGA
ncbi:MAG: D-2-hydroxyacid dehydrogenase family protein [Bradyrhizobiaceae bacterium]|nr:D-2-hydroxyacid dehydrogenase family protein [Bradyrhizobiaceae bacterium]